MKELRIIFMGTPEFAVEILDQLIVNGKNVVGVITAPDRPAGRGRKLKGSAVKEFALEHGLNLLQPTNLKDESFLDELRALESDIQIVVAFRMLPKVVWDMPKHGTFNLHASLLPHYRGAAPINWAIISGESTTGVTTFFIDEKIDTGAIIMKEEITISEDETAGSLHDRLMNLGAKVVLDTVSLIENDKAVAIEQEIKEDLRKAPKLTPENTRINWDESVQLIDRLIRGLDPYPVAWSMLFDNEQELKVKIYKGEIIEVTHSDKPGTVVASKNELKVAALNGYIRIKEMQLPGKRKMDTRSLLNGYQFSENAYMM
jgi:methionyl-tRNA formyltransferase